MFNSLIYVLCVGAQLLSHVQLFETQGLTKAERLSRRLLAKSRNNLEETTGEGLKESEENTGNWKTRGFLLHSGRKFDSTVAYGHMKNRKETQ